MTNPEEKVMNFAPYVNNTIPKTAVFVSPEGIFLPMEDGKWPVHPFAYDAWYKECMSWYDTCYLHAGLNPFVRFKIHGKDFLNFLEAVSVNTFRNFPIGKARHTVLCSEKGKIMLDGIVVRFSEEDFMAMCLPDPNLLNQMMGNKFHFECEDVRSKYFFYQMCGPKSLEIVENACRQDLHDIQFMFAKEAKINGHDVFVLRTGMAGTLGYEVHGRIEDALDVYNELLRVGQDYGIQELGRIGYINAHCEGSIPQVAEHFMCDVPGMQSDFVKTGSLDRDSHLWYRSPYEVGWGNLVKFNHDFMGKEALQKEAESRHKTMVHLVWNREDVLKVVAASMDGERHGDPIDMFCDYDFVRNCDGMHMDAVYDGNKFIGASSGRMLSAKTREMISICSIDPEYQEEGREVEVLWGNPGTCQTRIRAKVMLFPYNKVDRNEDFDVERIPHYKE